MTFQQFTAAQKAMRSAHTKQSGTTRWAIEVVLAARTALAFLVAAGPVSVGDDWPLQAGLPLKLSTPPPAPCRRGDDWPLQAAPAAETFVATAGPVPAGRMIGHYRPACR